MRILLLLLALVLQFAAMAQTAVINGQIINPANNKVSVYYNKGAAIYGFNEVNIEAVLDKKGRFKMVLPLEAPAEVILSYNEHEFPPFGKVHEQTNIFLEPGNELVVKLNPQQSQIPIKYEGKGAANNNFMVQFSNMLKDNQQGKYTRLANSSALDYIAFLDSLSAAKMAFYNKNLSNLSAAFKRYFVDKINYATADDKISYPGLKKYYTQKEPELPADYYKFLENTQIQNDSALFINEYVYFLSDFLNYETRRLAKDAQLKEFKFNNAKYALAEWYLTGKTREVALTYIAGYALTDMPFTEGEKLFTDYKNTVSDKDLLAFVSKKYERQKRVAEGALAPDFSLKDTSGKMISLQDFRGKIVYLDFWASWCGPCMKEAPYAVKLQEQFAGKDIVFLYVSADDNEEMWRKAVSEKLQGKGVHLISKKAAENMQENYNIDGIPAYFLIGRDGKILNGSASRPSDEKTVELLNNALAQP